MKTALLVLHVCFSLALFWACFCRATRTSRGTTRYDAVLAFWLLSTAALISLVAPWGNVIWPEVFGEYVVTWIDVLQLGSVVVVLTVSSRGWQGHVPSHFRKKQEA